MRLVCLSDVRRKRYRQRVMWENSFVWGMICCGVLKLCVILVADGDEGRGLLMVSASGVVW